MGTADDIDRENLLMQRPLLGAIFLTALFAAYPSCANAATPMWQKLVPRKNVPADPQAEYTLAKEHGPWLIMAMYFPGEDGKAKAHELVLDLRQNHGLNAYHWGMSFKHDDENPGAGFDDYGGKVRRRYRRGNAVTQHAVLIGHFPSLGDPEAQSLLKKIKTITPIALSTDDDGPTAESLTHIGRFRNYLLKNNGKGDQAGPMRHAFVTRNPLLPKEYFVPTGIDESVAKWNTGIEYSLLKCPKRYTIKVATFKGRTSLQAAQDETPDTRTRRAKKDDPLVLAVKNAHLLTVALREKGWEAYEFHDRYESYVTIGSFDEGRQSADGSIALAHRDAQIIMDTFGATKPNNIFNRPAQQDLQLEAERKRMFATALGNQGQVANGFYPKKFVGLPFDIYPAPIVVPRRSISSAYARN